MYYFASNGLNLKEEETYYKETFRIFSKDDEGMHPDLTLIVLR